MKAGGRSVCMAVILLLAGILVPPFLVSSETGGPSANSMFAVDVPTWYVGDTWTYQTHLRLSMGENYTDLVGSSTYLVTELFQVRQNGTFYEAYNVSVTGSFTGSGMAYVSGFTLTITIDSASLAGYQWFDRSDLSLIRDNETIVASGNVTIFIFDYALEMRFSTTDNRTPSQEDYDFPLFPGDDWHFAGNMRSIGYYFYSVTGTPLGDLINLSPYDHNSTMDFDAQLSGTEIISVGGSSYTTYHVVETPTPTSGRVGDGHLWYSPVVKNNVRQYLMASTVDYSLAAFTNLTSFTLNSPPFALAMNIDPQIVNPGGTITVSGTVGVSSTVTIMTPWNESSWSMSSIGNAYSFTLRAPMTDDHTPANSDVGSHGVLVGATDGVSTSYNASTVVLIVPDLSITQSDLSFLSPPRTGIQTTIMAVVHASPGVGVFSNMNVDFSLDGSFLARDSTGYIVAGGQHTFNAIWTPTAGTHTIGANVDPANLILEGNESNNYAEISATTSLPDLVPWNITIDDGGTTQYLDPALTGYASDFVNASFGERMTITFSVGNRGNDTFGGQVRCIAIETQGLFGPSVAPPFFDTTINATIPVGGEAALPPATWPVPATVSVHYINLTVDPDNLISEDSDGNNTFAIRISVGAPDLTVEVTGPAKVPIGGLAAMTVVERNIGSRSSPWTNLSIRDQTTGQPPVLWHDLGLNPGDYITNVWTFTAPLAPLPSACFEFEIDPEHVVQELDESNNVQVFCYEATARPETTLSLSGPIYTGPSFTYITNATDITLSAVDHSGTGIKSIAFSIDGGPWNTSTSSGPITFRLNTEGAHTIRYNSTDNVGGRESYKTATYFVDDLPPVTTAAWNGSAFSLEATDGGCGLNKTYYSLDSSAFEFYISPVNVSSPGAHRVEFYSVDLLGNVEKQKNFTFTVPESLGGPIPATDESNLKPYVAVAFVIVLLIVAFLFWRKKKSSRPFIISMIFSATELATGFLSLSTCTLAIKPAKGEYTGLFIDIAILVVGLFLLWFTSRKGEQEAQVETTEETS